MSFFLTRAQASSSPVSSRVSPTSCLAGTGASRTFVACTRADGQSSKGELTFRISMYIAMAPLAGAFGGLLAYGIVNECVRPR